MLPGHIPQRAIDDAVEEVRRGDEQFVGEIVPAAVQVGMVDAGAESKQGTVVTMGEMGEVLRPREKLCEVFDGHAAVLCRRAYDRPSAGAHR
jgi:hypothetical protein